MKISIFTVILSFLFTIPKSYSQSLISYLPLKEDISFIQAEASNKLGVEFRSYNGVNTLLFNETDNNLSNDNFGLEFNSPEIVEALNEMNFAFSMDFCITDQNDPNRGFSRRLIQIGDDNDFMIRLNNWDDPDNQRIDYEIAGEYGDFNSVKAYNWYSIRVNLLNDTFTVALINKQGQTVNTNSHVVRSTINLTENSKMCIGNKSTRSPDQFNGGICNVVFMQGPKSFIDNWNGDINISNYFLKISSDNLSEYTLETTIAQNAVESKIQNNIDTFNINYDPEKLDWIVQGHVMQNDNFSSFSAKKDTLFYDAWINRGEWVTIQAVIRRNGFNDVYSNILRVFIEENQSNTNDIKTDELRIADNGNAITILSQGKNINTLRLTNLNGQLIAEAKNTSSIKTINIPHGVYYVTVIDNKNRVHQIKWSK